MGKLIVISGPNDSGKSRFAETLVCAIPGRRLYIATMVPQTDENLARIEKHRAQREGLGFEVFELPFPVRGAPAEKCDAVLLEDISNLLANGIFDHGANEDAVFGDIIALRDKCAVLAAVTVSGLSPDGWDDETSSYIRALNSLNERLADAADASVEMFRGEPTVRKGDPYGIR